jgi:hypothetical protein
MGNWDNLYHEILKEVTQLEKKQKFNFLIQKLSIQDKFKYKSVRDRWCVALQMIRNDEQ